MNPVEQLVRAPVAAVEFANLLLTRDDAQIGVTPKDVVWTHRKTTLYRYRSTHRTHALPILLVFALINRPDIFDLRPGNSFVEYLLEEGYDVFLLDWGVPGDEDADMGIDNYVCDELPWAIRETLRASGQDELSLLGWCIGGTLVAMHAALEPGGPARNLVLLTTPVDTSGSLYTSWVGRDSFDPEFVTEVLPSVPGAGIDWANKMMKPVTNFWTTYRTLWQNVLEGEANPRGLPVDGELGGRQPAVPGPGVQPVDHLDVQGEPARRSGRCGCAAERVDLRRDRPEHARRHRRRRSHRAPRPARCRCSTWSPART